MSHLRRAVHSRWPLHVTLRLQRHVWQLRSRRCYRILERAFYAVLERPGARLTHFSVQHDHVHVLVEAPDVARLARTLQALTIRMAKGLNRLMGRRGRVFADRYHSRPLRTPTEVRRALVYVLCNARKHLPRHGHVLTTSWVDEFSSGRWFDGWAVARPPPATPAPVSAAKTWLLTTGWRTRGGGPIRTDELTTAAVQG